MKRYRLRRSQVFANGGLNHSQAQVEHWPHQIIPGLALSSGLALVAICLHALPQLSILSSLILAIGLGISVRNTVGVTSIYEAGIRFALRRILRIAIVLLGLQLSLSQIVEVGFIGLAIIGFTLFSTFYFTCWLGEKLGVCQKLTQLIAAGTAICGASAIVATNAVVESSDEDVAYAIAMVTVFGTASMFLYPLVPDLLNLTPQAFGIWCGASIHEVAQVIAAAFQGGTVSGQLASVSKLSRVLLLAPVILILGTLPLSSVSRTSDRRLQTPPVPWFVLGFVGLIALNSFGVVPATGKSALITANQFLMTIAIAAMGLETNFQKMMQAGLKPLYLAASSWVFISIVSFALIVFFYQ